MGLSRVLIANRGEIAVRVIRACQALGIQTVLAMSEADRDSLPAKMADKTVCIGPALAAASYLNVSAIVAAAIGTGADAIHPGYGFLAESFALAAACVDSGVQFIGPRAETISEMGDKLNARARVETFGVPVLQASPKVTSLHAANAAVESLGLPLIVKAAAGGGGKGIKILTKISELGDVLSQAGAEARAFFGDDTLYLERYVPDARHVEVQVLGDQLGDVIHLGERDCSLQRRYQKVIEEAPATALPVHIRRAIQDAGITIAQRIGYESAGTVEFVYDRQTQAFYFLEMNTRIQVEHPVTEEVTGIDLVQAQLRIASEEPLWLKQRDVNVAGHAIECRINAEAPARHFQPSPGQITTWAPPVGPRIRVDTHCYSGYRVPPYYDSLLAKLIVSGSTRSAVLASARLALDDFQIAGIETNVAFLSAVLAHDDFVSQSINTRWLETAILPG
jgi:acetyl-CoA carboxylase biotin carboxylase subunit